MGKYIFTAIAALIFYGQASAQLEKGKIYTGIKFKRSESVQYGYEPSLSVGLGKHGLLSLHSNYMRGRNFYYTDFRAYGVLKGIGLDYTYFRFFKNSQRLGWFATVGATYYRINGYQVKNDVKSLLDKYGQTNIYLKPGIFFKSSPNVTFFANFGGIGLSSSRGNNDLDRSFLTEFNIGVLINIGTCKKRK